MMSRGVEKMQYDTLYTTATQRVIARLYAEGWVTLPRKSRQVT